MPEQLADPVVFAHHSEAMIARLLEFYGIQWQYEPRSFPLQWDADGRPTASFTPDFYLPDSDLFIEVTTVKPSLAYRKHRKIRLLRERYPDVNIKLLALKDVEALGMKYGRRGAARGADRKGTHDLSGGERPADRAGSRHTVHVVHSVPTDLSTRRDRDERGEL